MHADLLPICPPTIPLSIVRTNGTDLSYGRKPQRRLVGKRRAAPGRSNAFHRKFQPAKFWKLSGVPYQHQRPVVKIHRLPAAMLRELEGAGHVGRQQGESHPAQVERRRVERLRVVKFQLGGDDLSRVTGVQPAINRNPAVGQLPEALLTPIEEYEQVAMQAVLFERTLRRRRDIPDARFPSSMRVPCAA